MKKKLSIGIAAALVLLIGITTWSCGSSNPETKAGYVGYLTHGAVFGKSEFVGTQTGPTSAGRGWLLHVVNVSITPYTFTETFDKESAVLAKDNLKLSFAVHVGFRIDADHVKEFVERFSTLSEGEDPDKVVQTSYQEFVMEPLKTYARDEVQKLNGLDVKDKLPEIGDNIFKRISEKTKGTPFQISSVVVGNIQYPEVVQNAVSLKLAATQEAERVQNELEVSKAQAEKEVAEAEGKARSKVAQADGDAKSILAIAQAQAKANEMLAKSLTGQVIEYKKIETWNGVLPTVSGGVPLISISPGKQ